MRAAEPNAVSIHVQALVADPHAAVAENAAGPIVIHQVGKLALIMVELGFHEARFRRAVAEYRVLKLAFATLVADRAVKGDDW